MPQWKILYLTSCDGSLSKHRCAPHSLFGGSKGKETLPVSFSYVTKFFFFPVCPNCPLQAYLQSMIKWGLDTSTADSHDDPHGAKTTCLHYSLCGGGGGGVFAYSLLCGVKIGLKMQIFRNLEHVWSQAFWVRDIQRVLQFIYSSAFGGLGCFQFLALMNVYHEHLYVFMSLDVFISLG